MKSPYRFSAANGSTRRKVEMIVRQGERATRRSLNSARRRKLDLRKQEGGFYAW